MDCLLRLDASTKKLASQKALLVSQEEIQSLIHGCDITTLATHAVTAKRP